MEEYNSGKANNVKGVGGGGGESTEGLGEGGSKGIGTYVVGACMWDV